MAIPLSSPTSSGPPAVSFKEAAPGDQVVLGIVNVEDVQSRDFDTGDLEFWNDGNPKMHPRITGLVVSATDGVRVGSDDEARPVEVGEVVSIYAQSGRIYTWREAHKAHGTANVGDVLLWRFDREEEPRNKRPGMNKQKVFVAKLRGPDASKDGDLLDRCEATYYELRDRVTVAPAPAAPAPSAPAGGDIDDF